ncbi:conserved protein, unknown function [Hepatocystis sp. ex Piliocolobus tephrosceles]|nr:conserved protein, unknown function [Hepatocystis sp. ex Piliocolobus tephrosceles]
MEDKGSYNLIIEKRHEQLKQYSSDIRYLLYELKDLIKVHEILMYKEKLKITDKWKIKKQQDELDILKNDLEIIKKENEKIHGQLKYYKKVDDSVNKQMNYISENIRKLKMNISREQQKKVELQKNINEIKSRCSKSLKQKQLLNESFIHITKNNKLTKLENNNNNNKVVDSEQSKKDCVKMNKEELKLKKDLNKNTSNNLSTRNKYNVLK